MKRCTRCKEEKPLAEFNKRSVCHDKKDTLCRPCRHAFTKAYDEADPEKTRRTWRRNNLKRMFGVTPELVDAMLAAQSGCCAICKDHWETKSVDTRIGRPRMLGLDHDHQTGALRQLLCELCNRGLGLFQDSPALLRAAADYLERHAQAALAG